MTGMQSLPSTLDTKGSILYNLLIMKRRLTYLIVIGSGVLLLLFFLSTAKKTPVDAPRAFEQIESRGTDRLIVNNLAYGISKGVIIQREVNSIRLQYSPVASGFIDLIGLIQESPLKRGDRIKVRWICQSVKDQQCTTSPEIFDVNIISLYTGMDLLIDEGIYLPKGDPIISRAVWGKLEISPAFQEKIKNIREKGYLVQLRSPSPSGFETDFWNVLNQFKLFSITTEGTSKKDYLIEYAFSEAVKLYDGHGNLLKEYRDENPLNYWNYNIAARIVIDLLNGKI